MICGLVGRNGWTCASRRTCSRRTPPGWRVGSVYAPKKMKLTWCLLYCVLFLLCAKSLKTGYNIGNKHVYVLCNTKKYLHLGLKINFGMMQRDLFESVYLEIPFLAGWHIAAVRTVPTPETSRNRCAQIKITNQNWSWQNLMKTLRKMMRLTRLFAFEIDLCTEVVHKDQNQAFYKHLKIEAAPYFCVWALITQLNELVWLRSFVCHICCPWKVLHGS